MSEYSHSRAMEAARELFPTVETHGPERSTEQFAKLAQGLLQTHEWAAEIILKHMRTQEIRWRMCESEQYPGMMELRAYDEDGREYYLASSPCGRICICTRHPEQKWEELPCQT